MNEQADVAEYHWVFRKADVLWARQHKFAKGAATTATVETILSAKGKIADDRVHETVRRRIDGCSYKVIFGKVTWICSEGHLTLRGCVPSFHLKQRLQELLRGIGQVTQVTNSVDVVSSTSVSREHSHKRQ